jgi:hypothetical protein
MLGVPSISTALQNIKQHHKYGLLAVGNTALELFGGSSFDLQTGCPA